MFGRKRDIKFGARILKLGASGLDVGELQQKLKNLGYEPGPVDNYFGYLTQEALEFFQRDYRLRIDGIAGEQVYALLKQEKLPVNRRVHVVQPGETITDIAARYNVGQQAFRNHKRKLYPGQELIFFDREVWGLLSLDITGNESLTRNKAYLTGVFIPVSLGKSCREIKSLGASSVKRIAGIELNNNDKQRRNIESASVHTLLTKRKVRKDFLEFCLQLVETMDGIYLPWEYIPRVDGNRYYKLIRRLKSRMKDKRLLIMLTPKMPRWNILGGIDFSAVSRIVNQVVIKLESWDKSQPLFDKEKLEAFIHTMLNYIPSYKILLQIPVYALMWNTTDSASTAVKLSYSEAMTKVFVHGAKLETDDDGRMYYVFISKNEEWQLQICTIDQINQAVALINRYNLAGLVIDSLGKEDKRLWQVVQSHFSIQKYL